MEEARIPLAGGWRRIAAPAMLAACLAAAAIPAPAPAQEQEQVPILVITQERILREAVAPRALAEREQAEIIALQRDIEAQRIALQEEEIQLAGLRDELPADEFEARAADFDARMRAARRSAQDRLAGLQARFRVAREELVRFLPQILADIAEARGALLVVDSSTVLIASPRINVTDEVIARLDARVDAARALELLPEEVPPEPDPVPDATPGALPDPSGLPAPGDGGGDGGTAADGGE